MPKLIKDGQVVDDEWQGKLLSLAELNESIDLEGTLGLVLEADQPPSAIETELSRLDLIAINFPVFTDGRGFSTARELRELGFSGEIRATGNFIRDQLHYLVRCGFNAFEFADQEQLTSSLASLNDFSEAYQGDVQQKEPLFRRRSP
jgi:uncharacterized protein (DUF934 family)